MEIGILNKLHWINPTEVVTEEEAEEIGSGHAMAVQET